MRLHRAKIERSVLSEALLEIAKSHMRIEFARDDEYVTLCVARAIDFFERTTGLGVFPAEWDWIPGPGETLPDGTFFFGVPFQPAPIIVKVLDGDGLDVTSRYEIRGSSIDGYAPRVLVALDGAPAAPPSISAKSGYADPADMPPGILGFVLEAAAWFYENREAAAMPGVDGVPYLNQLLTSYWVPRV